MRRHGRTGGTVLGALVVALVVALGSAGPAGADTGSFYVAVGGSGSVGVQPTATHAHGQPTDRGYANDLLDMERARWHDLRLVQFGCPGATTTTVLFGGARCHYDDGSQLADVAAFLHTHRSTVLMTVDIGFNNVLRCLHHEHVDPSCVEVAVRSVHDQLIDIVHALRRAGDPAMHIVGVGHYDPFLADSDHGAEGRAFAAASAAVMDRLNLAMERAYASQGVPMADVERAFASSTRAATAPSAAQDAPADVARVCALTWMCAPSPFGPNLHPNDLGYRTIAEAIADVVRRWPAAP